MKPATRFVYLVRKSDSSTVEPELSQAYASCWVLEAVASIADQRAREFLARVGWQVQAVDSTYLETERTRPPGTPGHEYLTQVQTDGIVVELHTWNDGSDPAGAA